MEHFKTFGEISEMNVLKKPDGKLVGCAFIQYVKYEDAVKAIQKMNGTDYLKRNITVDFAVSKNRYDNNRKPEDMEIEQLASFCLSFLNAFWLSLFYFSPFSSDKWDCSTVIALSDFL